MIIIIIDFSSNDITWGVISKIEYRFCDIDNILSEGKISEGNILKAEYWDTDILK